MQTFLLYTKLPQSRKKVYKAEVKESDGIPCPYASSNKSLSYYGNGVFL